MVNTIKNLLKIEPLLSVEDLAKLEQGAVLHKRHSNIVFKVIEVSDTYIIIETRQEKSLAGNYLTKNELIQCTRDLFSKFLPNYIFKVAPLLFVVNFVDSIDHLWVNKQMFNLSIRSKQIAADTGIDKTNLSHFITGNKPMSQIVKAMFYFYFASKSKGIN